MSIRHHNAFPVQHIAVSKNIKQPRYKVGLMMTERFIFKTDILPQNQQLFMIKIKIQLSDVERYVYTCIITAALTRHCYGYNILP